MRVILTLGVARDEGWGGRRDKGQVGAFATVSRFLSSLENIQSKEL